MRYDENVFPDSGLVRYQSVPNCLEYHPLSPLRHRSGYYPNIDDSQLVAVNKLVDLLEKNNIDYHDEFEDTFLKLLRFLRARKFNPKLAYDLLVGDIEWRRQHNIFELKFQSADEVFERPAVDICKSFPSFIPGFDNEGRPVSFRHFGHFEIWNMLKLTSLDKLVRFHVWESEQCLRLARMKMKSENINVETFVVVADAQDWGLRLATADAFAYIKGMIEADSLRYPERLGMMMVINAPSMLALAWRSIQAFLDDVTKAKIKIYAHPSEWQPVLLSIMNEKDVPKAYGGTAPDLSTFEEIATMNPPQHSHHHNSYSDDNKSMSHTIMKTSKAIVEESDEDENARKKCLEVQQNLGSPCQVATDVKIESLNENNFLRKVVMVDVACQTDQSIPFFPVFDDEVEGYNDQLQEATCVLS